MKIVLDMNIPQGWKELLEAQGHETIHWREIGEIRAEDTEVMEWARRNHFIVFTHDLDFGSLLYATNANKPSVIQLRLEDIVPSVAGSMVIETLNEVAKELESGALVTIDLRQHRIRLGSLWIPDCYSLKG